MDRASRVLLASLVILAVGGGSTPSQTYQESTLGQTFLEPVLPPPEHANAPQVSLELVVDIPLPGPLPGDGPRIVEQSIEIPVADAVAITGWTEHARPELRPATTQEPASETENGSPPWVAGPKGKFRYQARPEGLIVAQKRCKRCGLGWKRAWKLRVGGSTLAPPLVTDRRIYFPALDNHVYSIKRKNGHRVWAVDIGRRISSPLTLWRASHEDAAVIGSFDRLPELLLAVPDDGGDLFALSLESGVTAASFEAQNGDTLVGTPVTTPDGRIVLARQRYAPTEASLLVLRVVPTEPPHDSPEDASAEAKAATDADKPPRDKS
jgi:hypothetical protein